MKIKIFQFAILFIAIVVSSSFTVQTRKEGVYNTYEDYINGKVTDVGEFKKITQTLGKYKLIFKKGEEDVVYDINENVGIWGFRNSDGEDFRIAPLVNKDGNTEYYHPYKIAIAGKINFYVNAFAKVTHHKNGNTYVLSDHPRYLSKGSNNQIYLYSNEKLKEFLSDDPEVLENFKIGTYTKSIKDYNERNK